MAHRLARHWDTSEDTHRNPGDILADLLRFRSRGRRSSRTLRFRRLSLQPVCLNPAMVTLIRRVYDLYRKVVI
jgi:hypothetical protein